MSTMSDLILKVEALSPEWYTLGKVLHSQLGPWRQYGTAVDWFSSQKARYVPQPDQELKYYSLEFDSQEDLTEFVLKWL
jgi:hypothetical protein